MANSGTRFPQASRPFNDASLDMGRPPQTSRAYSRTGRAALTAGTLGTVGDHPSREDAERNVVARDADWRYLHGVQHDGTTLRTAGVGDQLGCESVLHGSYSRSVRGIDRKVASSDAGSEAADVRSEDFTEHEALRQSRLRRWQAIR